MKRLNTWVISPFAPTDHNVGWIDTSDEKGWVARMYNGAHVEDVPNPTPEQLGWDPVAGITEEEIKKLLDAKQDKLISGENIKTLSNKDLLGEGNIAIKLTTNASTPNVLRIKLDSDTASSQAFKTINSETLLEEGDISLPTEGDLVFERGTGTNSIQQKGTGAVASGTSSVAEGGDNLEGAEPATGEELLYTKSEGYGSHAEGAAHAIGRYSHAEGGGNSIVDGKKTVPTAEGSYSHAEGTHTYAKGTASHVEGNQTEAEGYAGHAEGQETYAKGFVSHAEGWKTQANGAQSHAEGYLSKTSASNAHAEGLDTRAFNESEHAEGAYNKSNSGNSASLKTRHSVGIGTSSQRKNAFEIMQNGDVYVVGLGGYDGTNAGQAGVKTLQTLLSEGSEVFVATYDTTTYQEIRAAYEAGKLPIVIQNNNVYVLAAGDLASSAYFISSTGLETYRIRCTTTNVWGIDTVSLENRHRKVTGVPTAADLQSTDKYPSMKIMADYVADTAVCSTTIRTMVTLSQAEYDALADKDANTFYVII